MDTPTPTPAPQTAEPEGEARSRRRQALMVAAVMVAVFLIAETAARTVEPNLPDQPTWGHRMTDAKVEQLAGIGPTNVVILGSSAVVAGIDAAAIERSSGQDAYNAALVGATPRVWKHWLERVVTPSLAPSRVIVGVSPVDFDPTGLGHAGYQANYVASTGYLKLEGNLFERADQYLKDASVLYARRDQLRRPSTWRDLGSSEGLQERALDGYGGRRPPDDVAYRTRTDLTTETFNSFATPNEEHEALRDLITALQDRGITPAIVVMPAHVEGVPGLRFDANGFAAFMTDLGTELAVPIYIPPADLVSRRHFVDTLHLKEGGTARFTKWLIDRMEGGG